MLLTVIRVRHKKEAVTRRLRIFNPSRLIMMASIANLISGKNTGVVALGDDTRIGFGDESLAVTLLGSIILTTESVVLAVVGRIDPKDFDDRSNHWRRLRFFLVRHLSKFYWNQEGSGKNSRKGTNFFHGCNLLPVF